MITIDLNCRLLCASESAYAIDPSSPSGQYNPLYKKVNGKWIPDPKKAIYQRQYDAVGFIDTPFVVTALQIEAVLVGKTDIGIVIAFRGTLPPIPFTLPGFFDWMQNLWAAPVSHPNLPGKVHHGFLEALLALQKGIIKAVTALDPRGILPIYITGHSKGGGIAPIAAMFFRNAYKMQITQTVTFAGPKPGDAYFCHLYDNFFTNGQRYENYLDIVPLLPPSPEFIAILKDFPYLPSYIKDLLTSAEKWDYSTVGTLNYIDSKGDVAITPDPMLERIADIMYYLVANPGLIVDAHHASCGYRYMKGTCKGSVCPA